MVTLKKRELKQTLKSTLQYYDLCGHASGGFKEILDFIDQNKVNNDFKDYVKDDYSKDFDYLYREVKLSHDLLVRIAAQYGKVLKLAVKIGVKTDFSAFEKKGNDPVNEEELVLA